jgi:hypothetical protein
MKIYINNFNLNILNDIADLFKEKLVKTKTFIELYTNEGIYHIHNKNIYITEIIDKDIVKYEKFYNNFTLIVDLSYIKENNTTNIEGTTHLPFEIKKIYHKLSNNSSLYLVIEYYYKKSQFIPNNIYFESEKEININDIFIKKELIEFLSILN